MNIEPIISQIDIAIKSNEKANERLEHIKKFCYKHAEKLSLFAGKVSIYSGQIDFDYLDRPTTLEVIKAFPGRWNKSFNEHTGKVDYTQRFGDVELRCWASPPLESCKLIEVVETVPARIIPAETRTVFKLDCGNKSADDILNNGVEAEPNIEAVNQELQAI